jgi:RNA polymerase sigma factor (sigma-70 family)
MARRDTSIGGSKERFPDTIWSCILSPTKLTPEARREKLQGLLAQYWRPVYTYIRLGWRKGVEDSKDLAQDFFAFVLESDLCDKYRKEQGRFRTFLKASLKNFLSEAHRDSRRLKRGGGRVIVPLAVEGSELESTISDSAQLTPEELYDREWAAGIMTDALAELRRELKEQGRSRHLEVFEAYDLSSEPSDRSTYQQIAESLGLSLHDVRNYLVLARRRLKELIARRVGEYVTSREELLGEIRDLSRLFRA